MIQKQGGAIRKLLKDVRKNRKGAKSYH